jgi:hypothetical protein
MALGHFCFGTTSKEDGMKKSKKAVSSVKLVQLKKMTPRIKALGKRASKTSAVKG